MAGMSEIAIGIATVLGSSSTPEPLYVDLRGQSTEEAILLIRKVVDECVDAEVRLGSVVAPTSLLEAGRDLRPALEPAYRDVPIRRSEGMQDRIEFHRHRADPLAPED